MNRPIINTMTINKGEYAIVTGDTRELCQRELKEQYPNNKFTFWRAKWNAQGFKMIVGLV